MRVLAGRGMDGLRVLRVDGGRIGELGGVVFMSVAWWYVRQQADWYIALQADRRPGRAAWFPQSMRNNLKVYLECGRCRRAVVGTDGSRAAVGGAQRKRVEVGARLVGWCRWKAAGVTRSSGARQLHGDLASAVRGNVALASTACTV